jgi:heme/copper-type cytochrome/quinol oxidase subunit 3
VARSTAALRVITDPRPPPVMPSAVLAMLIFVSTEVMLFAGLISAFLIIKASAVGAWPPPGQPRLPFEETAVNTLALLVSGVMLWRARHAFAIAPVRAQRPLAFALGLGAFFVLFQGYEWVMMIGQGLTLQSSNQGSFFYLIVGLHALHAIAGLATLAWTWWRLRSGFLAGTTFAAIQVFWFFVVGLWPVLYLLVYT